MIEVSEWNGRITKQVVSCSFGVRLEDSSDLMVGWGSDACLVESEEQGFGQAHRSLPFPAKAKRQAL